MRKIKGGSQTDRLQMTELECEWRPVTYHHSAFTTFVKRKILTSPFWAGERGEK